MPWDIIAHCWWSSWIGFRRNPSDLNWLEDGEIAKFRNSNKDVSSIPYRWNQRVKPPYKEFDKRYSSHYIWEFPQWTFLMLEHPPCWHLAIERWVWVWIFVEEANSFWKGLFLLGRPYVGFKVDRIEVVRWFNHRSLWCL